MTLLFPMLAAAGCADVAEGEIDEATQPLQTFPNEKPAFDFFRLKGLTNIQSAGIVGNLDAESGLDPTISQLGGGPGRGIAQWSAGARWDTTPGDNVLDYAVEQGQIAKTLDLQLKFIWFELTMFPGYGLAPLQDATTLAVAVSVFKAKYEGCPACATGNRVAYAQSVLDRFGNTEPGSSSSSSSGGGDACTVDGTGTMGECITTSACSDLGGTSTPGFCPGASDVQCCTDVPASGSSGSSQASSSGGKATQPDGGSVGDAAEGTTPLQREEPEFDDPGGCSAAGRTPVTVPVSVAWLAGLALALGLRRKRAGMLLTE